VDILGWAFSQRGRYPDAFHELSEDPVICDHLGEPSGRMARGGRDHRLAEVALA
jgi:hypothetical protein